MATCMFRMGRQIKHEAPALLCLEPSPVAAVNCVKDSDAAVMLARFKNLWLLSKC